MGKGGRRGRVHGPAGCGDARRGGAAGDLQAPGPAPAAGRPTPTRADYARYARQAPEQIARDCEVWAFHATGPGGQGVNTADSAVRMRHTPTGVTVVARESRSQHQNRLACLEKLAAVFAQRAKPPKRRVRTSVPRSQKERRLKEKHRASRTKEMRRAPRGDDGW